MTPGFVIFLVLVGTAVAVLLAAGALSLQLLAASSGLLLGASYLKRLGI